MRQQQEQHQPTTTVAILGLNTMVEGILTRLLEEEGYSTRNLEASYPTALMDELLEGVDVVLVAPGLKAEAREAFLEAMRGTPKTAAIPVLSLSSALKQALLDELSASLSWRSLLKELVNEVEAALARAAASPGVLPSDGGEAA